MKDALQFVKWFFIDRAALVLILNDAPAKKVMVAWTLYGPKFVTYPTGEDSDPRVVMDQLWEMQPDVDFERLAEIAAIPVTKVITIFSRLQAAYLVFPDGTAPEGALRIIRAEVGGYIASFLPYSARRALAPNDEPKPTIAPQPTTEKKAKRGKHERARS